MKFCSYNFVFNKAPNNKDIMHLVNILVKNVSNSNVAMHVVNNVHLAAMGTQQIAIMQTSRLTGDKR